MIKSYQFHPAQTNWTNGVETPWNSKPHPCWGKLGQCGPLWSPMYLWMVEPLGEASEQCCYTEGLIFIREGGWCRHWWWGGQFILHYWGLVLWVARGSAGVTAYMRVSEERLLEPLIEELLTFGLWPQSPTQVRSSRSFIWLAFKCNIFLQEGSKMRQAHCVYCASLFSFPIYTPLFIRSNINIHDGSLLLFACALRTDELELKVNESQVRWHWIMNKCVWLCSFVNAWMSERACGDVQVFTHERGCLMLVGAANY